MIERTIRTFAIAYRREEPSKEHTPVRPALERPLLRRGVRLCSGLNPGLALKNATRSEKQVTQAPRFEGVDRENHRSFNSSMGLGILIDFVRLSLIDLHPLRGLVGHEKRAYNPAAGDFLIVTDLGSLLR